MSTICLSTTSLQRKCFMRFNKINAFTILYDVFSIQYNFAFSLNFRCEYSTRRAAHLKNEPIVGYNLDFARSNLNFEHGFLPDSIFEFCSNFKKHFCGGS